MNHEHWMGLALDQARQAMQRGGGPFGAVIIRSGTVVASGGNNVTSTCDPTAHAEIVAIRAACEKLGTHLLDGCSLYSSCEPCPMCLAATYWARLDGLYYAGTRADAADAGFDDDHFYRELALPSDQRKLPSRGLLRPQAQAVFKEWRAKEDRQTY